MEITGRSNTPERDNSARQWMDFETFRDILDKINSNIYILEPGTGRILFMNHAMASLFGIDPAKVHYCWEVFRGGMTGSCPSCRLNGLDSRQMKHDVCVWEEENPRNGRIYEHHVSLIRWSDGSPAYLLHSIDITEMQSITQAASHDELTGLMNRRKGKEFLNTQLLNRQPFTLCMMDVNDLKKVNDTYGHLAGDCLLVEVAQALKSQMSPKDCLFRLSGDEFVAILTNADKTEAARRMEAALASLRRPDDDADKFCFGLAEVPAQTNLTADAILSDADAELYIHKRKLHILRAEEKLKQNSLTAKDPDSFTYDQSLLYDAILQSTDDYLYVCNMKTGVFRYSQAMVDEFALPGQVIENAAAVWGAKVHPLDKAAFLEANQDITDGRTDQHCVEYRARNRNGEWLWMRCRGHLERDQEGNPSLFAGFITNLGKKNKFDHLTGLYNRLAFEEECVTLLDTDTVTLMVLGIDDLKRINSLYDRAFGDEVIRIVSQRIQSFLPPNAQAFRLDGDEFGILIRGGDVNLVYRLYDSIHDAFGSQKTYDGKKFFCTLSCGCIISPRGAQDYLTLCKRAGFALDYAKLRGKNRLEFFRPEIMAHLTRDLEMTELLRESTENHFNGFRIFCQPVFHAVRSLYGAEALCRWSCDKYGNVPPGEFIGLLEKSGMIINTGRFICREAIRQCALFQQSKPDFRISINLSILQMDDPSLVDYILKTAEEFNVSPGSIILELTESCLAANIDRLRNQLLELRSLGFLIAMDDFGTGYSSLGLLKQAPIDIVKLDYMFVQGILENQFDLAFIRMTVELCHIVGIQVCLEGVETEEEYLAVKDLGLDYLQGFLLGKPCPPEEFIEEHFGT